MEYNQQSVWDDGVHKISGLLRFVNVVRMNEESEVVSFVNVIEKKLRSVGQ